MKAVMVGAAGGQCGERLGRVKAGLEASGVLVHQTDTMRSFRGRDRYDFAICWGWRRGAELQKLGHRVLCIELGYIGDRSRWTSIAWDGLNGRGNFCLTPDMPPRFAQSFELKPWKAGGDRVLIMGQVPGDMSLQGRNLESWYRQTAVEAAKAYGLPVDFRPHPRAIQRGLCAVRRADATGPLEDELARSAVVITFNSNSAVDAVVAGVPAVTIDPGAMAWGVSGHAVGDLIRPDRQEWADRLAWCQWSPEELSSGVWWERMKAGL